MKYRPNSWFSSVMDFFFPRCCANCGCRLPLEVDVLCLRCNMMLPRTRYADTPYDNPMARRFWGQMSVQKVASWIHYVPKSDSVRFILAFKYGSMSDYGQVLGRMMAVELLPSGFFEDVDLLLPVPLSRGRKRERGYSQTEELALGVSMITGIPVNTKSVRRVSFRTAQAGLREREKRYENVDDAFSVEDAQALAGKHVMLIDDVCTTGSTLLSLGRKIEDACPDVKTSILTLAVAGLV